jgi:hypothetical protein
MGRHACNVGLKVEVGLVSDDDVAGLRGSLRDLAQEQRGGS